MKEEDILRLLHEQQAAMGGSVAPARPYLGKTAPRREPRRRAAVDAAILDASKFDTAEIVLQRFAAFLLIGISLFGTYVAFSRNAIILPTTDNMLPLVCAVGWQAICTVVQFVWRRKWWSTWYILALGASVIPSIIAYGVILKEYLAPFLSFAGEWTTALWWVVVTLAALMIDMFPEQILVRR